MTILSGRKREPREMHFGLEEYKCLFESTQDALVVYVPSEKKILLCNRAFLDLFGFVSKEEIRKRSIDELSAVRQPDGRLSSILNEKLIKHVLKKKYLEGRWLCRKSNGDHFLSGIFLSRIDIKGQPMILVNLKDITEESKTEAELRDRMFSLDVAVNGTGIGLWDWDIEEDTLVINDSWFHMLGYQREDFEDRYDSFGYRIFTDNVHPDDMEKVQRELKKHYSGEIEYYRVEIRMKTAAGEWKWILASGKLCEWNGKKPKRMVGVHTDIDYRIKMEEQLKEAMNKARESDKLKSAFLANMSHEIRTPMNAIIGFLDLMEFGGTTELQRKEYNSIIKSSARQLLDIVNDIVDMSKIEAGQIDIFESALDIRNMFGELAAQFKSSLNDGVKIAIQPAPEGVEESIMTDQSKLRQILTNLLSNAVKYTVHGEISLGYLLLDGMLQFYISDTGEGIDPDNHELIFERFRQVEPHPSHRKGGTGLGLSICKAYVEKLGGRIWLESGRGQGSTFYFTIPYKPVVVVYEKKENTEPEEKGKTSQNRGIILIVEDELYNFLFAEHVLTSSGFRVIHSETGTKAIDHVRSNPEIRLVLMDIRLPDINGYEATREIKRINPELPVVALTALALSGDRESALDAGCNDYLKKPITKDKLMETVMYFLGPK